MFEESKQYYKIFWSSDYTLIDLGMIVLSLLLLKVKNNPEKVSHFHRLHNRMPQTVYTYIGHHSTVVHLM